MFWFGLTALVATDRGGDKLVNMVECFAAAEPEDIKEEG